ncbi:DUF2280 domain-containing protein [Paraburkholderia caffeinilytica]|uniref:DUF2280 domain-containing protein n=1 Tax=Paraburkholderia caffeinilytica TaxID=1761016 RepID=UPI0038B882BD
MAVAIVKPRSEQQLLTLVVKRAIVKLNAEYAGPTEIVERIAEEFGIKIPYSLVYRYNPDFAAGLTLSSELKDEFYAARRAFADELNAVPGSVRATRMARLDSIYHMAMKKGDLKAAIAANEALRKEMDTFEFFNGGDGGVETWPAN